MYIYFDELGVLREIISDTITRQGDADNSKIYVYMEGGSFLKDIWVRFELPNGDTTIEVDFVENTQIKCLPPNSERDLKFFKYDTPYQFYVYTIPSQITQIDGLCLATIRCVAQDESIFALGTITFNVEKNVIVRDTDISISQYDYLIKRVSNFVGAIFLPNVSEDGVISWTNNAGMDNPTPRNITGNGFSSASGSVEIMPRGSKPSVSIKVSGSDKKNQNINFDFKLPDVSTELVIDDIMSTTSTNPVQNKVITSALDTKQNKLQVKGGLTLENDVLTCLVDGKDIVV